LLNWRRDPGYEQRKMQHEQRMKQLENDILQAESDILVESLERLHQAALLSARFQLDPSELNRARWQTFLALISGPLPPEKGSI
jgi:hypothetical protein